MAQSKTETINLFATPILRGKLPKKDAVELNPALADAALSLAEDDLAGQKWCEENGYQGYTSYASLDDLAWRMPPFAALKDLLDPKARSFARVKQFDLAGRKLEMDSLWVNILEPGGSHSGHIHPHAVLSGTYYVEIPNGASAIRFEDPRLGLMMAAPPKRKSARQENQPFVSFAPEPGTFLIWESWLRHEVPPNNSDELRISISFNYAWGK